MSHGVGTAASLQRLSRIICMTSHAYHLHCGAYSFTTATGGALTYFVTGNGPTVLVNVAPGWGPSSVLYQNTFGYLERDFTFVHLEQRGTRGSAFPAELLDMSSWHMAEDIESLRAHLGIEVLDGIIGHSNGGTIALWHAIRFPGRTKTLVLVDFMILGLSRISDPATRSILSARPEQDAVEAFSKWDPSEGKTDDDMFEAMMKFLQLYVARPERDLSRLLAGSNIKPQIACARYQQAAEYQHDDQVSCINEVIARTLVIVGREDFICPVVVSEFTASKIRDATLVVIEDSGHMPFVEKPNEFGGALKKFYGLV